LKLCIKNITGPDSKRKVWVAIENVGLHPVTVETGEIEIKEILSNNKYIELKDSLLKDHFELVTERQMVLIEKIKCIIIEMIHYAEELPGIKHSDYISKKIGINYTYLSKLFSKINSITIEHFIIAQKIEYAKHLLLYNELTLSEIAWKLQYSSTAHLSAQFKKVTGLTSSRFKKLKSKKLFSSEILWPLPAIFINMRNA
jgi:AraC-like DNA-binding protein